MAGRRRFTPKGAPKKESVAQRAFQDAMEERGWVTKNMHGSKFQAGFPDVFCVHPSFGIRLVEVKMSWGRLTPAQRHEFHRLSSGGASIWIVEFNWPLDSNQIAMRCNQVKSSKANWHQYL
jgi:hypothetical protein